MGRLMSDMLMLLAALPMPRNFVHVEDGPRYLRARKASTYVRYVQPGCAECDIEGLGHTMSAQHRLEHRLMRDESKRAHKALAKLKDQIMNEYTNMGRSPFHQQGVDLGYGYFCPDHGQEMTIMGGLNLVGRSVIDDVPYMFYTCRTDGANWAHNLATDTWVEGMEMIR